MPKALTTTTRVPATTHHRSPTAPSCSARTSASPATLPGGTAPAFLEHRAAATGALGRRYLITLEQFADVHAQENRIRPGGLEFPDDILDLAPGQQQTVIDGAYGAVVALDPVDAAPTFTFTAPTPPEQRPPAAPSAPYLATILHGLREVHDLDDTDIVERVGQSPGVRPNWSPAAMHQLLDTPLIEISSI